MYKKNLSRTDYSSSKKDYVLLRVRRAKSSFSNKMGDGFFLLASLFSFVLCVLGCVFPNMSGNNKGFGEGEEFKESTFATYYGDGYANEENETIITKSSPVDNNNIYIASKKNNGETGIREYIVKDGDTISSIANDFNISENTVAWANDISSRNNLKIGKKLLLLPTSGVLHRVKKNETVLGIANRYNVKIDEIRKQNKIADMSKIVIGTKLVIPGGKKMFESIKVNKKDYKIASFAPKKVSAPKKSNGGAIIKKINTGNVIKTEQRVQNTKKIIAKSKKLMRPTIGRVTQGYRRGHLAIDIAHSGGAPIKAAQSGVIESVSVGWSGGYGNNVVINHGNGMKTRYAHLKNIYVKKGTSVNIGESIGYMGNTGRVYGRTGIHLHFEVYDGNRKQNPFNYF